MNMHGALFSKKSDEWATPSWLYNYFMAEGFYDPCPLGGGEDALSHQWEQYNFVNPPFSKIAQFVDKAIEEATLGHVVVMLLPVRTDTRWFRKLCDEYPPDLVFFTKRLKFGDGNGNAPFPCMLAFLNWDLTGVACVDADLKSFWSYMHG